MYMRYRGGGVGHYTTRVDEPSAPMDHSVEIEEEQEEIMTTSGVEGYSRQAETEEGEVPESDEEDDEEEDVDENEDADAEDKSGLLEDEDGEEAEEGCEIELVREAFVEELGYTEL